MPKKRPKRNKLTVVICVLQGRPLCITDGENGTDLYTWHSIDEARQWVTDNTTRQIIMASESITIIDLSTGEVDTL